MMVSDDERSMPPVVDKGVGTAHMRAVYAAAMLFAH